MVDYNLLKRTDCLAFARQCVEDASANIAQVSGKEISVQKSQASSAVAQAQATMALAAIELAKLAEQ